MCSFVYQICPNIWLIMSIKSFEVTELSSNLCFNFKIQSMIMLVSVMIMMEALTTHTWHHALPWCMLFIKSYFLCLSKVWTINYVFTWRCPCKMLVLLTITGVVWGGLGAGTWATLWSTTYYHLPLPGQTIRQVSPHLQLLALGETSLHNCPRSHWPNVWQCIDGSLQASRSRCQFS